MLTHLNFFYTFESISAPYNKFSTTYNSPLSGIGISGVRLYLKILPMVMIFKNMYNDCDVTQKSYGTRYQ